MGRALRYLSLPVFLLIISCSGDKPVDEVPSNGGQQETLVKSPETPQEGYGDEDLHDFDLENYKGEINLYDELQRFKSIHPSDDDPDLIGEITLFMDKLIKDDPDRAIEFVLENKSQGLFANASQRLGIALAKNGQMEKVLKLAKEEGGSVILDGAVLEMAGNDPSEALVLSMLGGGNDSRMILYRAVSEGNPEKAIHAARQYIDPAEATGVIAGIYDAWASRNPKEALRDAVSSPPSKARSAAISTIIDSWEQKDSKSYNKWLKAQSVVTQNEIAKTPKTRVGVEKFPDLPFTHQ